MGAVLRLPDRKVRLPGGALADVLGLPVAASPQIVGGLLGVDEGGADRALQVLELLQPVAQARDLLAHPLVLRIGALELVGHRVQEVVDLVRVVAAEAALELLAPDVYRRNRHAGSPRHRLYELCDDDQQQASGRSRARGWRLSGRGLCRNPRASAWVCGSLWASVSGWRPRSRRRRPPA